MLLSRNHNGITHKTKRGDSTFTPFEVTCTYHTNLFGKRVGTHIGAYLAIQGVFRIVLTDTDDYLASELCYANSDKARSNRVFAKYKVAF
jgi:hypothetical protein